MFRVANFQISGQRGFEIRCELSENGDHVSTSGGFFKCLQRRLYRDGTHGQEDGGKNQKSKFKFQGR